MKQVLHSLFILLLLPVSVFSLFNSTDNFEIEGIVTNNGDDVFSNIQAYDKHHPFLGLFGAGFANTGNNNTAFTSYYDFCKDHGDGTGVDLGSFTNTSTDPLANNPKHNFKLLLNASNSASINVVNVDDETVEIRAADLNEENLTRVFDAWKDAHKCDRYFLETSLGFGTIVYTLSTANTAEVTGKPYQRIAFTVGTDDKVRYLYCYNNDNELNRDIALFLSQDNTANFLTKLETSNANAMLESILFNFLSAGQSETDTSFATEDTASFYLNIQGVTFPETPFNGSIEDGGYNALITHLGVENSGLGYYCKQIHDMHADAAQTNASNIETCIKNHVAAVLDGSGETNGICNNGMCDDRTIVGTTVKGGLEANIYTFPEFGYCSNDTDLDGFITVENTYNWGEFTNENMVPYANVPDVCPDDGSITNAIPRWFEVGNPTSIQNSCSQPQGFVATEEEATPSYQFQTTTSGNVVTLARETTQETEFKELQISSVNSQVSIQGTSGSDRLVLVQSGTSPFSTSSTDGQVENYCFLVKGNASNLTGNYLITVAATGASQGIMRTFKQIDSEQETYKELTLNRDGTTSLAANILTRSNGCSLE